MKLDATRCDALGVLHDEFHDVSLWPMKLNPLFSRKMHIVRQNSGRTTFLRILQRINDCAHDLRAQNVHGFH